MAALGPDFKSGFNDEAPVSNADIAPTLAHILGLDIPSHGKLGGRVITEALKGGPDKMTFTPNHAESSPVDGRRTILEYQELGAEHYFDRGCFIEADASGIHCH
jgi:arylsulfatase A-like enzyme